MSYQQHKSVTELNQQLLIGLKKHLLRAQDTSISKVSRVDSLTNLITVLEYVIDNINEACGPQEVVLYQSFFKQLLISVVKARVEIHTAPTTFTNEIGFISVLLTLRT